MDSMNVLLCILSTNNIIIIVIIDFFIIGIFKELDLKRH